MAVKQHSFANETIRVSFDGSICAHAGYCFRELHDVFDGDRDPPIDLSAASVEEIIRVVELCPSSALTYERLDAAAQEQASEQAVGRVVPNGPLAIRGQLQLGDKTYPRLTLCRCGQSKNKPFCDGTHKQHAFDEGEFARQALPEEAPVGGAVAVMPKENGPVILKGEVTYQTVTGETICRKAASGLCRCGHSKTKPFCDGSHNAAGFSSAN